MSRSKTQQQHCKPKKQGNEPLALLVKNQQHEATVHQWHIATAIQVDCYYFLLLPENVTIKRKINSQSQNTLNEDRNLKNQPVAALPGGNAL